MYQLNLTKEPTSIFRKNQLPSLLWVYFMDDFLEWYHPMHVHDDSSLVVLIIDGENEILMNNRRFIGKKGDLLILNQGEVMHERTHSTVPLNLISCAVQNVFLEGLPDNVVIPTHDSPLIPTGAYFDLIKSLMEMILNECREQREGFEGICQNLIITVLTVIYRYLQPTLCTAALELPNANESSQHAADIKKYIDMHFKADISLHFLANEFHFNPNYIVQVFKKSYGFSPIKYVIFRRIGEAQKLLLTTELSVVEIANEVGYQNVNYFYAQFKKYKGISPNRYRQISREQ